MTHAGRPHETPPRASGPARRLFPAAAGVAPELLRDAPRRLGLVGLIFAVGHVFYYLISLLQYHLHYVRYRPERVIAQYAGAVMGIAVFWISRRRSLAPEALVAVEHRRRSDPFKAYRGPLQMARRAEYGEVWITLFADPSLRAGLA